MAKKPKVLTSTLYTYVTPANDKYVRGIYKKLGFRSYSAYLDHLITQERVGKRQQKRAA